MVMRSKDRSRCLDSIDHYIDLWQDEPFEQILVELSGVGDPEAGRAGCRRLGCLTGFLDTRKEYFRAEIVQKVKILRRLGLAGLHFTSYLQKTSPKEKRACEAPWIHLVTRPSVEIGSWLQSASCQQPFAHAWQRCLPWWMRLRQSVSHRSIPRVFLLISVSGQRRQVLSHEIGRTLERHWDLNRLRYLGGKLRGW